MAAGSSWKSDAVLEDSCANNDAVEEGWSGKREAVLDGSAPNSEAVDASWENRFGEVVEAATMSSCAGIVDGGEGYDEGG